MKYICSCSRRTYLYRHRRPCYAKANDLDPKFPFSNNLIHFTRTRYYIVMNRIQSFLKAINLNFSLFLIVIEVSYILSRNIYKIPDKASRWANTSLGRKGSAEMLPRTMDLFTCSFRNYRFLIKTQEINSDWQLDLI